MIKTYGNVLKIRKYPKCKDSGIEWIGEIPEHWEVVRNGSLVFTEKGKNPSNFYNEGITYLSMEFLRNNKSALFVSKEEIKLNNLKVIDENEILLLWDGSNAGEFLLSKRGVLSSTLVHIKIKTKFLNKKYYYYLGVSLVSNILRAFTTGMGIPHVNSNIFKNMKIPLPPLPEQQKIAQFLDEKTKQIDRYIQKKQRKITLLKELKKTIINDAVIGKINIQTGKPYPKYKQTNIKWLPQIPEHWEVRKLRTILREISIRNKPNLPLLSVVREKGIVLRNKEDKKENHNFIPDDLSNYKVVKKGNFVINKMKAWQGSYGVSNYEGIVSPAYYVFEIIEKSINPEFFNISIRSKFYIPIFKMFSEGVRIGQWDLDINKMKEIPFILPHLPEQKQIAQYLDKKTKQIDNLIQKTQQEIDLIKEFKEKLIADATTGKIKVF